MKSVAAAFVALGLINLVLAKEYKCGENSLTINVENFENSDQYLIWGNDLDGEAGTKIRVVLSEPTFAGSNTDPFIAQWNVDAYRVSFNRKVIILTYNSIYNFGALLNKDSTDSDATVVGLKYKPPGGSLMSCTLVG
mmetsp:Transcript_5138/g.12574  ORF Transcript_5138/g.12574 Transcript_5138/m.12574 type:complete len:137 (+) Transcript_5138:508-918(+)|eukprot:CAMPEP_0198320038 /NCGR_PEP_ID=MMETSP1450-20131203/9044_1 /TAXON_ID=753684 ORGANISM="Madagascaria erythrocladiodes, Strain CCMP3234" /NCGR_SAMPLE_ID=MMETSP1450 /ASSEMBLY_ACC=CAM_ASM_001115 /LENGTH=136 /DNA_ID=CAMNT_0044023471 /DNA_START=398 /DNA_END=808 /DNA_ORIENTATION=+